ncbi:transglycosylase domain-containing protein, partial [Allorhizocola rhizosphaerae]|uniref:transglycosylase domain-containing protein n=1 Tax=Allorhizocola rhizosphaerae TaxID=1872709 RepID=UPI001478AC50
MTDRPAAAIGRASVPPPGAPRPEGATPPSKKVRNLRNARKRRIQNWAIAGVSLVILLTGGGLIGGSYFYDKIPHPGELSLKNSTEVFAGDDATQLAHLGSEHRSELAVNKLPEPIRNALIAGEDKNFYNHHGVDLWGIARAAWNNLTGGETQGASTITQQYARQA